MTVIVLVLLAAVVVWAVARFHLDGPDLSRYDEPAFEPLNAAPSPGHVDVLASVQAMARAVEAEKGRQRLTRMRAEMDRLGSQADPTGLRIDPVTVAGRPAEWIYPADDSPGGRLLYIHGGAFTMGSPLSHRIITTELARRTGLAVLAIDYRLMPEHGRKDGIEDCRNAFRWMLQHGPEGASPAPASFVAGDSAGGNLTLMLIAWIRDRIAAGDETLTQVDGAIALSPLTDATFSSPSLRYNADQDPLLGAMAKLILRIPRILTLYSSWLQNRLRPAHPTLSPARGDLSRLPPVLVQASEAEVLIDDARRYANKARDAGSPVELETWHAMVHVWPAFGRELPEAEQAFERMAAFVERVLEARGRADAA